MIAFDRLAQVSRWCIAATAGTLLTLCVHAASVEANSATTAELEGIKGIGPRMAANILNERRSGNFRDWVDLVERVQGIGPGSASKFSNDGLTVNGAPYSAPPTTPSSARGQHRSASSSPGRGVIMTIPQPAAAPPQSTPSAPPSARTPAERKPAPRPPGITQAH